MYVLHPRTAKYSHCMWHFSHTRFVKVTANHCTVPIGGTSTTSLTGSIVLWSHSSVANIRSQRCLRVGGGGRGGGTSLYYCNGSHLLLHCVNLDLNCVGQQPSLNTQPEPGACIGTIWERMQADVPTKMSGKDKHHTVWFGRPSDNQTTAKHRVSSLGGFPVACFGTDWAPCQDCR
jgi:hypothetical protein